MIVSLIMNAPLALSPIAEKIKQFGPTAKGVFSSAELSAIIASGSELKNLRTIRRLVRDGVLTKIQKGFYVAGTPDLWLLATRLNPKCVISMDSVLARNGLIGTVPARSVCAIGPFRPRFLETPVGMFRFFSSSPHLMFGFKQMPSGVCVADSEKAYLDMLSYYVRGARFVVDPLAEVALDKLDAAKIKKYLKNYRNPQFIKFVKGVLNGR